MTYDEMHALYHYESSTLTAIAWEAIDDGPRVPIADVGFDEDWTEDEVSYGSVGDNAAIAYVDAAGHWVVLLAAPEAPYWSWEDMVTAGQCDPRGMHMAARQAIDAGRCIPCDAFIPREYGFDTKELKFGSVGGAAAVQFVTGGEVWVTLLG